MTSRQVVNIQFNILVLDIKIGTRFRWVEGFRMALSCIFEDIPDAMLILVQPLLSEHLPAQQVNQNLREGHGFAHCIPTQCRRNASD